MAKRKNPSPSSLYKGRNRQALESSQSAEVGWLRHEFADHPARGLTPARLHQLLTAAEQGDLTAQTDLFTDMEERDAHLFSDMSKRKRAVVGLSWSVKPCRNANADDKMLAQEVLEWLEEIDGFDQIVFDALDAIGHGYSAQEITWQRAGALWLPQRLDFVPPRFFTTPQASLNEIRLRDMSMDGAELWPYGWLLHTHQAKSGYVARAGLHRILSWPFLFKHYGVRDLMEFLEIYGLPMRLGKYPSGATDSEKDTLLRAVMSIGHHAAGIIPQGMSIEFEEAAKGTADPHMRLIDWCEKCQSKAILGGTLTSSEGSHGTQALGNVHNEVRRELTESDALQLARTLNQSLIAPMLELNKPQLDPSRYPRFYFDLSEPEDIQTYADALPKLVGVGMQIPQQWAHEKLGIPMPEGNTTPVLTTATPKTTPPMPLKLTAASRQLPPLTGSLEAEDAVMQSVLRQLGADLQPLTEQWLADMLARIQAGTDPTEMLAYLSDMLPTASEPVLQDWLTRLIFVAETVGRLTVQAEMGDS